MCGLAGMIGGRGAEAVVNRMADALDHRGPDDDGMTILETVRGTRAGAFGHRRLAVLDLTTAGSQPMTSSDGRWTIVYNGEIYNFREIRDQLRRGGARFRSESDTEVLLEGWARHGPAFLERLRGMFALALWDRETGRAFLARDSFGIKPLYHAETEEGVLFASEVRALLASGRVARTLSRKGVASYLSTGSAAEPWTIIEGIRALPAGTCMEVSVGADRVEATEPTDWTRSPLVPVVEDRVHDRHEAALRIRSTLLDSIAHHLVSDVPVGLFLSGGIDSSAVVALAAEVSDRPPATFTIVFAEDEYSEAEPARALARRYGNRHHEISLEGGDLLQMLPDAFRSMDQPSTDGFNTYAVSRAVRARGIKVALSGLGGDELFAGYPSFRRARRLASIQWLPGVVRRLGEAMAGSGVRREKMRAFLADRYPARAAYRGSRMLFGREQVRRLTGEDTELVGLSAPEDLSLLGRISWYELSGYMRDTLLRDSDVFSMAHGLELRVPFVDREMVRVAMSIDDELKLEARRPKPMLVEAVEDLLPREVWDRPKQGFVLPFERWMRGALRAEIERTFVSGESVRVGIEPGEAREVWGGYLGGRGGMNWARPWALYTLVRWARENDAGLPPVESVELGEGSEPFETQTSR